MLGISPVEYFNQTRAALTLSLRAGPDQERRLWDAGGLGGLFAACSGRSAAAVGQATTSAVVTSIVCIITASAILTVIFFRVW